jgi:hypothetical protein
MESSPKESQMTLRCPKCRLINPPEAKQCDCGWEFATPMPSWLELQFFRASWVAIILGSLVAAIPMIILSLVGLFTFKDNLARRKAKTVLWLTLVLACLELLVAVVVYMTQ